MTNKRDNTKRLARNTALLYVRSFFNLVISLYSSRLVLQALGVDDYGLYNAVAGFASMFWLVTGSISAAISRFLTFELGRNDHKRLEEVFSMSLNLMLAFAAIVFLLAETGGVWFVLRGISGTVLIFALSRFLDFVFKKKEIVSLLGGGTLVILGLHSTVIFAFRHIPFAFEGYLTLLEALIILLLFIPINFLVRK